MSTTNRAKDRDEFGRLKRHLRGPNSTFSTPGHWVSMHMNRPLRQENRRLCRLISSGRDPEGITWPLGSKKPHVYYW